MISAMQPIRKPSTPQPIALRPRDCATNAQITAKTHMMTSCRPNSVSIVVEVRSGGIAAQGGKEDSLGIR